jgi:WD40 repeat protein/predicted Ser/Thr protein kinase
MRRVDELCDRYESAWRAGDEPTIAEFTRGLQAEEERLAVAELTLLEHALRTEQGLDATLSDLILQAHEPSLLLQILVETHPDLEIPPESEQSSAPASQALTRSIARAAAASSGATTLAGATITLTAPVESQDFTRSGLQDIREALPALPCDVSLKGSTFGSYLLMEELGKGGMGVVYKAWQPAVRRFVALKMVKAGGMADPSLQHHFSSEIEMIASLDHPGIVTLLETGEESGIRYFTMQYVEGKTVREHRSHIQSAREQAALVIEICEAMEHAHRRGVLHRDLKPSNVLVSRDGHARVIDFGLAKRFENELELASAAVVAGSPSYIAPEQLQCDRRKLTTATDVYGIGTILYYLLTGQAPFHSTSIPTVLKQVLETPPEPVRSLAPKTDRDLALICEKCLRKDPAERYPTAAELGAELSRWLDGRPITARDVAPWERSWKWIKRHPAIAALAAMLLLAVLIGGGGILWNWREAVAARDDAREKALIAQTNERIAKEQESEAQKAAYGARLLLMSREWQDSNTRAVKRLLEMTKPRPGREDLRGFEWGYLSQLTNRFLKSFDTKGQAIQACCFLPGGERMLTAGEGGAVRLWDVRTGALLRIPVQHRHGIIDMKLLGEGTRLLTSDLHGNAVLWDLATGQAIRNYERVPGSLGTLRVSSDEGHFAAACGDGFVRVWKMDQDKAVQSLRVDPLVDALDFGPENDRLAIGLPQGEIQVWNWLAGEDKAESIASMKLGAVTAIAWVAGGNALLAGFADGTVGLFDVATRDNRYLNRVHASGIWAMAVSPDGKKFATAGPDRIAVISELETGRQLNSIRCHEKGIRSLSFNPDGRLLLTCSGDGTAFLWDSTVTQDSISLSGHTDHLVSVDYASKGDWLVSSAQDGFIRLWDASNGQPMRQWNARHGKIHDLALSRQSDLLASCGEDQVIRLWSPVTGELIGELPKQAGLIRALELHPEGKVLAAAGDDGQIRLWDLANRELIRTLRGHTDAVLDLQFDAAGTRLLSGGQDDQAIVWDWRNGVAERSFKENAYGVTACAFTPDGRLAVSADWEGVILAWKPDTGEVVYRLEGHTEAVTDLSFTRDGRRLASAGNDRTLRVWDLERQQELLKLEPGSFSVVSVAFRPDGRELAAGAALGVLRVYRSEVINGQ